MRRHWTCARRRLICSYTAWTLRLVHLPVLWAVVEAEKSGAGGGPEPIERRGWSWSRTTALTTLSPSPMRRASTTCTSLTVYAKSAGEASLRLSVHCPRGCTARHHCQRTATGLT